jgi:hypothetical protein
VDSAKLLGTEEDMVTNTCNPDANGAWDDNNEWSIGVPVPGETVQLFGDTYTSFTPIITFGDLALYDMTVIEEDAVLSGNTLSLASTNFITGPSFGSDQTIEANTIVVGKQSSISGPFFIYGNTIYNNGLVGDQQGGSTGVATIQPFGADSASLVNTARLIASNGSEVELNQTNVTGTGGSINVSNGGVLQLKHSSIASSQTLNLGGETATTLGFDPASSTIKSVISGFDATDFIHLEDFIGGIVKASGTKNPVLTFSGLDVANGIPLPIAFTMSLKGSYSHEQFSLTPDAAGTGSILLVNHV